MTLRRLAAAGALALCLLVATLWLVNPAAADVRAVSLCAGNYGSIQAAIDDAGGGRTVRVPVGIYTETLVITESVTLQGGWDAGCATRVTSDPAQTVIDANQAGSVISITGGSPTIEGLTVTGGWAAKGGGIYIYGASPTLRRLLITGNTISTTVDEYTWGGGVFMSLGDMTLDHCDIVSNVAYVYPGGFGYGAGVHIENFAYDVFVIATRIMHNVRGDDGNLRGGGIFAFPGPKLHFVGTENLIALNQAWQGGGIYSHADIVGAVVTSNTAESGGGVYLSGDAEPILANSLIIGNQSTSGGSGVYLIRRGTIANNTIVNNAGGESAVVLGTGTMLMTVTNNVIAGHETGIYNRNALSPTLATNDLWENDLNYKGVTTGTTDVHVDPGFVDAVGGDYHLADDSPLIDGGTIISDVTADFDGDPRPIGVSHDIGFDEWGRFVYMPLVLRAAS